MSISKVVKENTLFSIISVGFLLWFVFLIILSILNLREVVFLDALDSFPGTNVSLDYTSKIPIERYLVEPFAGIAFILRYDFYWIIAFIIIYIIYRIIYLFYKRLGKIRSTKYKKLMYPIDSFMRFTFKMFSLTILTIGFIILIGYLSLGYFFVSRYFMVIVQIGIRTCSVLVLVKIVYIVIILMYPGAKFNYSVKKKKKESKDLWIANHSETLKKEFIYIVGALYILLALNILLISTPFPTHKIETRLEEDEVLLDFHVHTTMSDGWITPEERVMWYLDHGISGAVFADHDTIRGALVARKYVEQNNLDFMVFVGQEWTDNERDIHMNIYGLEEEIVAPMSENPTGKTTTLNASEMINYVKSKGGYVTVNHYSGYPGKPYTYENLVSWGIDGFEIVNGDHIETRDIRDFCLSNTNRLNQSLICIGGSDIHTSEDLNAFVKLRLDDPTNKTIDNIFKNLRDNSHSVIMVDLYSDVVTFPDEVKELGFEIIEDFINYIFNLNSGQVLSWMLWSLFGYLLIFFIYQKIKKANLVALNRKINIKSH